MNKYCPILATLAYVISKDGNKVLLVHRNKRSDDIHYGKYNGLGGKLQANEDIISGVCREIYEESGLIVNSPSLRGTISWPGFGQESQENRDWFGFIFRVDGPNWQGNCYSENEEGSLEWVALNELSSINFWESDRAWLDFVFAKDNYTFHGIAPFENGKMTSWSYIKI